MTKLTNEYTATEATAVASNNNQDDDERRRQKVRLKCHENYFVLHFEFHVCDIHRKHTHSGWWYIVAFSFATVFWQYGSHIIIKYVFRFFFPHATHSWMCLYLQLGSCVCVLSLWNQHMAKAWTMQFCLVDSECCANCSATYDTCFSNGISIVCTSKQAYKRPFTRIHASIPHILADKLAFVRS